ncbi:hypothetical protein [Gelria sp. Kuro-4]|uniref:hypothetical protein n=1 Tax=Gelria sp. Kuro-4 TaxID=2796927 RepID=UPI001BF129BA|nr:hypothetical protein [Gelria sp. Kuro-4]BCV23876.1 hypothetical protein kuro4_06490 [Gelria sp. Kuro-4]
MGKTTGGLDSGEALRRAPGGRAALPKENGPDVPAGLSGLDVVPAATVGELMSALT